jgi:DNA replication protein DnaC
MTQKKMRPDELLERIRNALAMLHLPQMAAQLDLQAPPDEGSLEMLWRLLEPQVIARQQSAVGWRIRDAKFPEPKSLDNFQFSFQPNLDQNRVLQLATLEFVRRGENLLVAGMSGTGKSHIGIALGYLACAAGFRTRYTTSADMLATLAANLPTNTLAIALRQYVRPALLIIDEVGLDRPERETTSDAQLFYRVIRPRHQAPRTTIITSNIDWDKWGEYLGDDVATVAILDRLIEHGHLLTINGPSYRAYEHEKLNASSAKPAESISTAALTVQTSQRTTKPKANKPNKPNKTARQGGPRR